MNESVLLNHFGQIPISLLVRNSDRQHGAGDENRTRVLSLGLRPLASVGLKSITARFE